MKMHKEVMIVDIADPITQMLAVFVDANVGSIPTMVHLDKKFGKIVKKDLISIIEFLEKRKNTSNGGYIYE